MRKSDSKSNSEVKVLNKSSKFPLNSPTSSIFTISCSWAEGTYVALTQARFGRSRLLMCKSESHLWRISLYSHALNIKRARRASYVVRSKNRKSNRNRRTFRKVLKRAALLNDTLTLNERQSCATVTARTFWWLCITRNKNFTISNRQPI